MRVRICIYIAYQYTLLLPSMRHSIVIVSRRRGGKDSLAQALLHVKERIKLLSWVVRVRVFDHLHECIKVVRAQLRDARVHAVEEPQVRDVVFLNSFQRCGR